MQSINSLHGKKTMVIIAHRLSTMPSKISTAVVFPAPDVPIIPTELPTHPCQLL